MVAQHYRWDFIGLSTDTKPTPSTSEKVTDGSTYYTSDNSKLYVWYKDQWYEKEVEGGGTTYTAGSGIDIADSTISVNTQTIQPKLTAGSNVTISDNTISATDTTYSNFTGTDGNTGGTAGLVPAPATTDADKFLKSDGTWATAGGGSTINVVQTTGTSTTDVMSQKATTEMVYADPSNKTQICLGSSAITHDYSVSVGSYAGYGSAGGSKYNVNLGAFAGYGTANSVTYSVSLGNGSCATRKGEVNIGTSKDSATGGFNNTAYRVIGGVHDGDDAHDAVTVGQINNLIDAINTATGSNIAHIGN